MPINEMIYKKRKELGLTQEQIAQQLGVSIPAVSKWETGVSYPDITLIPALARLLGMDLNTLFCIEEELTDTERTVLLNEIAKTAQSDGIKEAFSLAKKKIRTYPRDVALIQSLAVFLQGTLMMQTCTEEEKEQYDQEILELYEKAGESDNKKYADQANYMLASRAIQKGDYARAQELIDRLPEHNALDKYLMQASLWMQEEKLQEAAEIYENKLLTGVNDLMIPLMQLIHIAVKEKNNALADRLVRCGEQLTELFSLWNYNASIYSWEQAVAQKDIRKSVSALEQTLERLLIPWDMTDSIFFAHSPKREGEKSGMENRIRMETRVLKALLSSLEENPEYEFMRADPDFQKLVKRYRERIEE